MTLGRTFGAAAVVCLAVLPACGRVPEPDARFVCPAEIKGFDPVFTSDSYASGAQFQVYEGLLEIHPFKRPLVLMPLLAASLPEESPDHLVYTFRLRGDAVYQDDECFPGGKGRKVTAQDFVWCFKRMMAIPTSNGSWAFAGKIKGLDEWAERASAKVKTLHDKRNNWFPFESPEMASVIAEDVPGLRAIDDRTLRVELSEPYPVFLWVLSMGTGYVYPHEAVEHYGVEYQNHPVGSGPYRVPEFFIFDRKITFLRNPTWHGQAYPAEGAPGDKEAGLLADAGKAMPFLDRIEFVVIRESQPRWLEFADGSLERVETEKEIWERAMDEAGKLKPDLAQEGKRVQRAAMANIAYVTFNMDDPVIGAPAGEKGKKIRQAMSLAFDTDLWLKIMRNGHTAIPAHGPIPTNVFGYVDVPSPYSTRDLARARQLLAEAGYPEGRGLPKLHYEMSGANAVTLNGAQIFKNSVKEIGIEVELIGNTWDQFIAKLHAKNAQMSGLSWSQDYPDAQDFLQLFYGPNESPGPNDSNYKNPAYDELYKQMNVMQDGPERDAVIRKMLEILNEDCPWSYTDFRTQYSFCQPWLRNFKYSDINMWTFKYYDVDKAEKARRLGKAEADQ